MQAGMNTQPHALQVFQHHAVMCDMQYKTTIVLQDHVRWLALARSAARKVRYAYAHPGDTA